MSRRSMLIEMRPKRDAPAGVPVCPKCHVQVAKFTLVAPSLWLRVRSWLFGHSWMPQAFVVLHPCGHKITEESSVAPVAQLAYLLGSGADLPSVELVPESYFAEGMKSRG